MDFYFQKHAGILTMAWEQQVALQAKAETLMEIKNWSRDKTANTPQIPTTNTWQAT